MQHGCQRDKQVLDAALTTTLLIESAQRRHETLFLLYRKCAKCYDRIPRRVMDNIYRRLGAPATLRNVLLVFLAADIIVVRTAYGWMNSGEREFGLGQALVPSILHIGYWTCCWSRSREEAMAS